MMINKIFKTIIEPYKSMYIVLLKIKNIHIHKYEYFDVERNFIGYNMKPIYNKNCFRKCEKCGKKQIYSLYMNPVTFINAKWFNTDLNIDLESDNILKYTIISDDVDVNDYKYMKYKFDKITKKL